MSEEIYGAWDIVSMHSAIYEFPNLGVAGAAASERDKSVYVYWFYRQVIPNNHSWRESIDSSIHLYPEHRVILFPLSSSDVNVLACAASKDILVTAISPTWSMEIENGWYLAYHPHSVNFRQLQIEGWTNASTP